MGIYLNPGNQKWSNALNSSIYVDKTEMILFLNSLVNTEQMYVSVSRPRRFGKSMAVHMLSAYFGRGIESRSLFEKTRLCGHSEWDRYLGRFDVLKLVMTRFCKPDQSIKDSLQKMQKLIFRDIKKAYPDVDYFDPDDIIQTMEDVYAETGRQFVILIDEWDAFFRKRKGDQKGQEDPGFKHHTCMIEMA